MSHLQVAQIRLAAWADAGLWRVLAFSRARQARFPFLAQLLRRSVLLVWWAATFQLHIHFRYWMRARRLRREMPPPATLGALQQVRPESINLAAAPDPLVSVVVPSHGQVDFTLRCLASIATHAPPVPIEVIVVDDAWQGADAALLDQVAGIHLIRNEINLGFLRSCNKAAKVAQGQYLLLMNNDTQVLDGWLMPMLDLISSRSDVGAVGAKLLYPDGRLQEAGGILWRDGSAWNFGRHEDPTKPEYNYVRQVDYCSGAALLVSRQTFLQMGGFDEAYAPAYYEDSDLCLRLRARGLKTLYQPASRIIHHEGTSHGVDTTVGIKSYQAANRRRFVRTWAPVLAARHYPHGQAIFRARDAAMHRSIVLVIDHYVPTPDRDAGSRTMVAFLEALIRANLVVKFWPHDQAYSPGYTEALQAKGIEVFYGPTSFQSWIKTNGHELDHVLVSRPDVAEATLPLLRQHTVARVVYYGHDLHHRRMAQQARVLNDDRLAFQAEDMRQREVAIWRQVDLSLYPSDEETAIAAELEPLAPLAFVTPYAFDRFGTERRAPENNEILFVGGFGHPPNEDAAVWLVREVLPIVRAHVPQARLAIVGSNPTAVVKGLACDAVTIDANVSDAELASWYDRARLAVVPLRCGAGVKMKVAEALREGLPLVTTPVGAQGLPELDRIVTITADPQVFAAAVIRLLTDDSVWAIASTAQLQYARNRFSVEALANSLLDAFGLPAAVT